MSDEKMTVNVNIGYEEEVLTAMQYAAGVLRFAKRWEMRPEEILAHVEAMEGMDRFEAIRYIRKEVAAPVRQKLQRLLEAT